MHIKSRFISSIAVVFLLITQTAHADFRKALDAYQKRDGETMLKEVKDAVDIKNDDGLILFISALQLDDVLTSNSFYADSESSANHSFLKSKKDYPQTSLQMLLKNSEVTALYDMLEVASIHSTLDAQYEYSILKNGLIVDQNSTRRMLSARLQDVNNRKQLIKEMSILASKGYGKAAFLIYEMHFRSKEYRHWLDKALQLGYQVETYTEYPEVSGLYLPKKIEETENSPIISIQRYNPRDRQYFETNYFLDIYENGDVNFSRGFLPEIPKNKQRIIQKIKPSEVKELVNEIKNLGFYEQALSSSHMIGDNFGMHPKFGGFHIFRTYIITVRDKNKSYTIISNLTEQYELDYPTFVNGVLDLIDTKIPLQFYKCGIATNQAYYLGCFRKNF